MTSGAGEYAYVERLLAEHRRLEQLIHRTLGALPDWESPGDTDWLPSVIDGLTAIRQEAADHFREEEMGGCLEEAVAHCPRLSHDLTCAQREQRELLSDLDELIARARDFRLPSIRDAQALGQELRALVHKLRAHEAVENRIIEHGFSISLENDDPLATH
jgi:hypothetical protein